MYKQKSLELRDINYVYENSWVWVNINSIKKKNGNLYKEIFEYYKNKNKIFCFFKGKVKQFVSTRDVEICISIDDNYINFKNNINYNITENVKYLLPIDTNFGCSDNTELIYLNPPNLLENIRQRYSKAYLNEGSRECIYTYIGYILLSVNPYEDFKIYDESYMRKIKNENNLFAVPHPFSIANDAYNCMVKDKVSQSIIISGESGAGKTESSKQVLRYLTFLSACHSREEAVRNADALERCDYAGKGAPSGGSDQGAGGGDTGGRRTKTPAKERKDKFNPNVRDAPKRDEINERVAKNGSEKGGKAVPLREARFVTVPTAASTHNASTYTAVSTNTASPSSYEDKIQNSNPLLESFGNAKTIKNDNSSRFGKLMKLNYDENGALRSASIETYLLAKSRVVDVPPKEGNYHIFYSLCENSKLREEFDLLPWYKYNYLKAKNDMNKSGDGSPNGREDSEGNEEGEDGEDTNAEGKRKKKSRSRGKSKRKKADKSDETDGEEVGSDVVEAALDGGKRKRSKLKGKSGNDSHPSDDSGKANKCLYDLDAIMKCFHSIGVYEEEQREIYKTLICILLLGNVDFVVNEEEEEGGVLKIKSGEVCQKLGDLLEISSDHSGDGGGGGSGGGGHGGANRIVEILTIKKVRDTRKNYTYQQAIYNRDVISKALYQLLFEYVIMRVNDSLNAREGEDHQGGDDAHVEGAPTDEEHADGAHGAHTECKRKRSSHGGAHAGYAPHADRAERRSGRKTYFIGILDIYGFENFVKEGMNCFEQLCINYANEVLHAFFLKQIIHNEHKIHYEENLFLEKIPYNDNSNVISLIGDTRDVSIYTILEDLSLLFSSNKSNEESNKNLFFEKLSKNVMNSAKYKSIVRNYKASRNCFIISHYAGEVLYDSHDFFNKNVDILTNDIEDFLSSCNSFIRTNLLKGRRYMGGKYTTQGNRPKGSGSRMAELKIQEEPKSGRRKLSVKEMISHHEIESRAVLPAHLQGDDPYMSDEDEEGGEVEGNHRQSVRNGGISNNVLTYHTGRKNKVKSIFSSFKKQLEILTNKLDKTASKFIRCIKPNEEKKAKFFNKNLVLNQLVMSGMVDVLSLMKNGYPCRVLYDDIWITYSHILQEEMKSFLTPKMFCEIVLKFLDIHSNEYTFGRTKVFFRFGVLSTINEILNKNLEKKNKFIQCVYNFWLHRRKRKILKFVLCGCRFKMLIKRRRAKRLMEHGLGYYNKFLLQKKRQSLRKILFYYFYVYKQRTYFLQLRRSSLVIQRHIRGYLARKKYSHVKRQILFIQDYYLFQGYFKQRVTASNIIRKNWLTYITKSDYRYVRMSIIKIQRAFRRYMKGKYINYCLKVVNVKKQPKRTYSALVKSELSQGKKLELGAQRTAQSTAQRKAPKELEKGVKTERARDPQLGKRPCQEEDRIGSFICVERPNRRHSFAMGQKLDASPSSRNNLKRRKTWSARESASKYDHKRQSYRHAQPNYIDRGISNHSSSHISTGSALKKKVTGSYTQEKPFISVGHIGINEKGRINGGSSHLFGNASRDKGRAKNKFRFSNLSICADDMHAKGAGGAGGKGGSLSVGKSRMKRKTYNHANPKNDFASSYKREKNKVSNFLKNTIYDRYISKYKQNHMSRQKDKKKKSIYIKNNYSNISNIYSVYRPSREEKLADQYDFDRTDSLIIPEDFYVSESNIPEPDMMQENNENYLLLCDYLDNNLNSKIPLIELSAFKCA
ncbi:myosin heavy chain subunit [Plasmodium vivax Brazil I]|uniref:Myosin heavy chain subunit n=1 Tax=Plasmodium vivax (strain Brazil I) TaxID=1033975 RepID=A0A0J9VID4_PLAV1|nr:myosin heavy chain subunit [Plasmodium vivax Brazil I]